MAQKREKFQNSIIIPEIPSLRREIKTKREIFLKQKIFIFVKFT